MDVHVRGFTNGSATPTVEAEPGSGDVKKGPWTDEEDTVLMNYVQVHGEGRWNSVAQFTGLRRTGKSCRLRWLNYLRPDVRRGNITLEEQLTILDLHFQLGNRWSKIAKYLPGRTDNEIKNYWRTRVQKQAKQLKCDVNSEQFRDAMRYVWMPRMRERIRASARSTTGQEPAQGPIIVHDSDSTIHPTVYGRTIRSGASLGLTHELDSLIVMSEMSGSGMASMDSSEGQLSPHSNLSDRTRVTGSDRDRAIDRGDDMWSFDGGDQSFLWDDFWNEGNIGLQLYDEDVGMNLLT